MAGRRPNDTRERIKEVAQRLIAEHGVDGISIRDIITAAGQRNMASLYYYFRSKDELIKELVVDASKLMEGSRADHLSRLEEIGEQLSVRQIVHVLISGAKLDPLQGGRNSTVMRFIGTVTHTHRHLFVDAIGDEYNRTYQRCLEMLRQHLSEIPLSILNQRLLFLSTAFTSLLVAREEALNSEGHARDYWSQSGTYLNLLDFMCGGLQAPVTPSELSAAQSREEQVRHFEGLSESGVKAAITEDEKEEAVVAAKARKSPQRAQAATKNDRAPQSAGHEKSAGSKNPRAKKARAAGHQATKGG